jgi:anti-sigma regulatory factor (Ser/Thr protein kinase)
MGVMIILGATTLEREPWSVSAARRYVRGMVPMTGAVADDIELITSELVTNALQHGGPHRIGLRVAGDEYVVRIEVTDSGSGKIRRPGVAADGESGRGLVHVEVLSERWGVRQSPTGTTVWAEIRRPPSR